MNEEQNGSIYIFFREDMFYPLSLVNDEDAIVNAECNPGTLKVEDTNGRVVWKKCVEKVSVEIQFDRVVTYNVRAEISKEDFEKIKDIDGDDIDMYIKEGGKIVESDVYEIINEFATEDNEYNWSTELTNVFVTKLKD